MESTSLITLELFVLIDEYLRIDGERDADAFMEEFEDTLRDHGGQYRTLLHIFLQEIGQLQPMQKAVQCIRHFMDYLTLKEKYSQNFIDVLDESSDYEIDDDIYDEMDDEMDEY